MNKKDSDKSQRSFFDEMFTQHYPALFRYGKRIIDDSILVEDAIQNVFVRLWEKRDTLEINSYSAYLLASLRREILSLVNENRKETDTISFIQDVEIRFEDYDFLEQREAKRLLKQKISTILNNLSSRQREIIYLHFYEGKPYKDIANILDVNYQSVVNNLHRAFSKIRKVENEKK